MENPNVDIILSGIDYVGQIDQNVQIVSKWKDDPNLYNNKIGDIIDVSAVSTEYYCTGCRYCIPCIKGIDIPMIFRFLNRYKVVNEFEDVRKKYLQLATSPKNCIKCRKCEERCPQKLHIIDCLDRAETIFN